MLGTAYTVENGYLKYKFIYQYCTLSEPEASVTVLGNLKEGPMIVSI